MRITREYFTPEMQVLEFGCGTGTAAIAHAPYVKHMLAVFSAKMLEIAREKAAADGVGNVSFEQTSIDELESADRSFDVVLGLNVLHLVEEWEAAMAKVYRLLKPGGCFVSSSACLNDNMPYLKYVVPIGRLLGSLPLVKFFSALQLRNAMGDVGFEIEHDWEPAKGGLYHDQYIEVTVQP